VNAPASALADPLPHMQPNRLFLFRIGYTKQFLRLLAYPVNFAAARHIWYND
jgi:hypothetical protein